MPPADTELTGVTGERHLEHNEARGAYAPRASRFIQRANDYRC